jgi:hypothetical protein
VPDIKHTPVVPRNQLLRPSTPTPILPAIPHPIETLESLTATVLAMKEIIEVMLGRRGRPGDVYVSYTDLGIYLKKAGVAAPLEPPLPEPKDAGAHTVRRQE